MNREDHLAPAGRTAHRLKLLPAGLVIEAPSGASLQDVLFAHGVEFPCGGKGRCRGCRVRVLKGVAPITAEGGRFDAGQALNGFAIGGAADPHGV